MPPEALFFPIILLEEAGAYFTEIGNLLTDVDGLLEEDLFFFLLL